ncbi:MAG: AAA family ATPase, partial [Thermoanaerobaculia bacterium]
EFAEVQGRVQQGDLFAASWREVMEQCIVEIESALAALARPSPWGPDVKATDDFLDPLFTSFYKQLRLPNLMRKTDYHTLAPFVPESALDDEVREVLDLIAETAAKATPRRD